MEGARPTRVQQAALDSSTRQQQAGTGGVQLPGIQHNGCCRWAQKPQPKKEPPLAPGLCAAGLPRLAAVALPGTAEGYRGCQAPPGLTSSTRKRRASSLSRSAGSFTFSASSSPAHMLMRRKGGVKSISMACGQGTTRVQVGQGRGCRQGPWLRPRGEGAARPGPGKTQTVHMRRGVLGPAVPELTRRTLQALTHTHPPPRRPRTLPSGPSGWYWIL